MHAQEKKKEKKRREREKKSPNFKSTFAAKNAIKQYKKSKPVCLAPMCHKINVEVWNQL